MKPDKERFKAACDAVVGIDRERQGIGTLGEKTLHAVLKNYYESDKSCHEVKLGSFYADIAKNGKVTEIQTGSFNKLRRKLDFFLISHEVTVVYPIAAVKYVCWIDPGTGALVSRKKSPKKGSVCDSLKELYYIRDLLGNPNLKIKLVMLEVDEYKLLDGYGKDKKSRATKYERVPLDIIEETELSDKRDYMMLIPKELESPFTAKDFMKASKFSSKASYAAIKLLFTLGVISPTESKNRAAVYEIAEY